MAIFNSYVSLPEGNIYAVRYISPEHISPLGNRAALVTAPRCAKDASCSYCLLKCGDLDGGPGSMLPSSAWFKSENANIITTDVNCEQISYVDKKWWTLTQSIPSPLSGRGSLVFKHHHFVDSTLYFSGPCSKLESPGIKTYLILDT